MTRPITTTRTAHSVTELVVDNWAMIGTKANGVWSYAFPDDQIMPYQQAVADGRVLIVTRTVNARGTLFAKLARPQAGEGVRKPLGCGGKLRGSGGALNANAARADGWEYVRRIGDDWNVG